MTINERSEPIPPAHETHPEPDAHGEAALVLAESLVHGLCENMTLSPSEAVEIVDRAAEVQHDRASEVDQSSGSLWRSHALLVDIGNSLRLEQEDGTP